MKKIFGAIEAGGTKFVLAAGTGPEDIIARKVIETTTPKETLGAAVDFFKRIPAGSTISAIGIGSFGPADITRGTITTTPKKGWDDTDFSGFIKKKLDVPVGFDTDVNAAALGEMEWGAARGINDFIYITVGTGIGGGAVVNGSLLHGLSHPEMGHIIMPRGEFAGICPYHGNCLEGLASGPAIEARWNKRAGELPVSHPAWEIEAEYLASALSTYIFTLSPRRIIMGGGVMKTKGLMDLVRKKTLKILNGYLRLPFISDNMENFIVPPGLGDNSGIMGAIVLARRSIIPAG